MRLSLPFLLCVFVAALHFNADAERFSDARYQLGKALLRRAREINATGQSNGDELEDNESDMSEEERERVQQIDAAEDIFVGSGNHLYENQGRSENSDSKGEENSGDEDIEADETEEVDSPTSGDGNEGNDDDDEEEKSEDDDDDSTEKKNDKETTEDDDSSGSGLIENENAARRSMDASGSGSGSEEQDDDNDQSGSGESTIQELAPANTSQDEASGAAKETEEDASKKSEIEEAPSGDSDDEEDSGSAEVIRKGIESLSRLLTPVASGYDFELFSGNAPKNDQEKESEAEGESEKGDNDATEETHVKQCKRVCEDPMTYEQCAVPRCDYKMGTIKDLCIYLCKHQTPVCRQECE